MEQNRHILQSKFGFLGAPDTIERKGFHFLFDKFLAHRLITVIAGAGYGKSTTVAQAVLYLNIPSIWLRLDHYDNDVSTFLVYLISCIEKQFPEIGKQTSIGEQALSASKSEAVIRRLLNNLQPLVTSDILFVFDDCHTVYASDEIKSCMTCLLQNMPPTIHVVIVARTEPPWPLSLFRARQEVLDIREKDLNFSFFEMEQLYRELFCFAPDRKQLEILHKKTGGWVSGLILFYHSLQSKNVHATKRLIQKLNGSHDLIAAYLEENVYQQQSDEMKYFLLIASLLSRIDVGLCDKLTGTAMSGCRLRRLEDEHLFTFPLDSTRQEYYFHHLFHDFLIMKRAEEFDEETVKTLNCDIAAFYEQKNETEEALTYYLRAQKWENACRLLKNIGRWMLLEGRRKRFESYLERLPESYRKNDLMLYYLSGHCLLMQNKRDKAIRHFQTVLKKSRDAGEHDIAMLTLKEIALHRADRGDFEGAAQLFQELLTAAKTPSSAALDNSTYVAVLFYSIRILVFLGRMDEARYYCQLTVMITDELEEEFLKEPMRYAIEIKKLFIAAFSGYRQEAVSKGEKLLEPVMKLNVVFLEAFLRYTLSIVCIAMGQYEKAFAIASAALKLSENVEAKFEMINWFHFFMGRGQLGLENRDEGKQHITTALELFQRSGNFYGQAECHLALYFATRGAGDASAAKAYLNRSLKAVEKCSIPILEATVLCELALSSLAEKKFEVAAAYFKKAKKLAKPFEEQLALILCLQAKKYWLQGKKTFALTYLEKHLKQLAEDCDEHRGLFCRLEPIAALLVELYAKNRMRSFLKIIFNQIGPTINDELMQLKSSSKIPVRQAAGKILSHCIKQASPKLSICFFKEFRLYFDEHAYANDRWKNKNALRLFKFLAISKHKGFLPKDVFMELLWPEEDPQKTANRFHVTLSALRKTLEPGVSNKSHSSYILRNGDSYRLADDRIKRIDIEEFMQEAKQGKTLANSNEAIVHLKRAEELYTGDVLENELYEEWCFEIRENAKSMYMSLMKPILDYFEAREDYYSCIWFAEKFLSKDKYNEETYRRLMEYYSLTGDLKMVQTTFQKCRHVMTEILEIQLDPKTTALYHSVC